MRDLRIKVLVLVLGFLISLMPSFGQSSQEQAEDEAVKMVKQIYTEVSGKSGDQIDWDRVRSFFIEEAVIVLRTSREGSTRFTVEEFIQDFKDFYKSDALGDAGFKEEVLRLKSEVYYDIAYIPVVYEARIMDSDRPPQKGIDFWLLIRKDNDWKVAAVTNEIIRPGEEIPGMFED